jgi:hypothetical protein
MPESREKSALTAPRASTLERLLTLAKTPAERQRAWEIAERQQQNQIMQELVAEVKARSWGDKVSPALRAGIVRWGLSVGADPVEEIDILGGGPYLNAKYWMRLCAAEPDFLYPEELWVHDDPRADDEERKVRLALRVKYAIPDQIDGNLGLRRDERKASRDPIPVKAAVIVIGHFKDRGPFIGKKWSPSRANDDVGLEHPEASALTRAWRKMALQGVRQQPRVTEKIKALLQQQEAAGVVPELVPQPVVTEEIPVQQIPATTEVPAPTKMEQHQPTKLCAQEGPHPRETCGYHKSGAA